MVYCPVHDVYVKGWKAKAKLCRGCTVRNPITGDVEPTLVLVEKHVTWCRKHLTAPQEHEVLLRQLVGFLIKEGAIDKRGNPA